jgi:hypothetical protein
MELIEIVVLVLVLLACLLAAIVFRRRFLLRGGGAIDMSLRLRTRRIGRGWALGIARYGGDRLEWYRVFTLSPRPARVLPRAALAVSSQRPPEGPESLLVQAGAVIITCQFQGDEVQLAMNSEAVTGFMSWLESSPPGYTLPGHAAR